MLIILWLFSTFTFASQPSEPQRLGLPWSLDHPNSSEAFRRTFASLPPGELVKYSTPKEHKLWVDFGPIVDAAKNGNVQAVVAGLKDAETRGIICFFAVAMGEILVEACRHFRQRPVLRAILEYYMRLKSVRPVEFEAIVTTEASFLATFLKRYYREVVLPMETFNRREGMIHDLAKLVQINLEDCFWEGFITVPSESVPFRTLTLTMPKAVRDTEVQTFSIYIVILIFLVAIFFRQ